MKKFLLMLAAAVTLAVTSLSVSSCKSNPLVGTTWTAIDYEGDMVMIQFSSETMCVGSYPAYGESAMGTYTYANPTVTIVIEGDWVITGTVDKKTMTLYDEGVPLMFTKQ